MVRNFLSAALAPLSILGKKLMENATRYWVTPISNKALSATKCKISSSNLSCTTKNVCRTLSRRFLLFLNSSPSDSSLARKHSQAFITHVFACWNEPLNRLKHRSRTVFFAFFLTSSFHQSQHTSQTWTCALWTSILETVNKHGGYYCFFQWLREKFKTLDLNAC